MAIGDFMPQGYNFNPTGTGTNLWGSPTSALAPAVAATFEGAPEADWQPSRLAQMGARAVTPQFARQAGMGFAPAYGQYLMTGQSEPFHTYQGAPSATGWQDVLAASTAAGLGASEMGALNEQQASILGYLQGENRRRNALAILAAQRGGLATSMGGQAYQRAMANLYDLYRARAGAAGQAEGTFLSWLDQQRTGTA